MKKQGFTLIELMVVIVIMGILAAVAVPKLFGMIAKSKASEVGPAAGTYVKLQDAYVAESGAYYGSWKKIGYSVGTMDATNCTVTGACTSTTNNFNFSQGAAMASEGTAVLPTSATVAWQASNKTKLNECDGSAGTAWNWQLKIKTASSGTAGEYAWVTSEATGCSELTPNFRNLGTETAAATQTTGG